MTKDKLKLAKSGCAFCGKTQVSLNNIIGYWACQQCTDQQLDTKMKSFAPKPKSSDPSR